MERHSNYQYLTLKIKENVKSIIIGKEHVLSLIMTSIVAGGHVLLEDVPGTDKTVMAKSLAKSIGAVIVFLCSNSYISRMIEVLSGFVGGGIKYVLRAVFSYGDNNIERYKSKLIWTIE